MSYDISDAELTEIYAFAIQLGRDAGAMLLESLQKRRQDEVSDVDEGLTQGEEAVLEEKMNAVDIVTETDRGV